MHHPATIAKDRLRIQRRADAANRSEADEIGRRSVLDLDDESNEGADVAPGADPTAADGLTEADLPKSA